LNGPSFLWAGGAVVRIGSSLTTIVNHVLTRDMLRGSLNMTKNLTGKNCECECKPPCQGLCAEPFSITSFGHFQAALISFLKPVAYKQITQLEQVF
jgi:hypothetical protein